MTTDETATNHPESGGDAPDQHGEGDAPKKKRRRRRRRKPAGEGAPAAEGQSTPTPTSAAEPASLEVKPERGPDEPRKKRRRRRRREGGEAAPVETEHTDDHPARDNRVRRAAGDTSNVEVFEQSKTFRDLGLNDDILSGLDEAGFQRPTYIQASLLPPALAGRDVLGQAKTGTGKTAAFGLPLLQLCEPGLAMQAIVLAPTRELAIQITDEINSLGRHSKIRAITIYGGQRITTQVDKLRRNPEIIVGTPGRVLDMVDRGHLNFKNVRFAVLDEVDRMFDIGFRDDIRRILRQCPTDRQTIVVSATFNPEIEDLARRYMRDPEKIVTSAGSLTASMVEQHYLTVEPWDKKRLLAHLLEHEEPGLTLVFCRLKRTVDDLVRYLDKKGIEAHAMHGDMSQSQRTATMRRFKDGALAVLIASDLASRGIDVDGISHVVNFDLPDDPDLYVHRIGRTARAGMRGVAWSFVTTAQGKLLTQIEHLVNAEIPKLHYPDFEAKARPEGYRDEPTGGRPPLDIPDNGPARNRYESISPEDVVGATDAAAMAEKFPGGVVPTKLPPKLMHGRVRTRRG
ncbi:MAG: DEAD/DEAH box helicase [Phycisphaerales bacterium]|nr:DEAD/DEAH box helicase [Phycisphaerales bacterium]